MYGGEGDDQISGQNGDDTLYGGPGRDKIFPGCHTNDLYGGGGDDRIDLYGACEGGGKSANTVSCGPGRDVVSSFGKSARDDKIGRDCELVGAYGVG